MLKCVKSWFEKLRAAKSTKPITSSLSIDLLLIRDTFTDKSTMGELFLNGERMCDTLELPYKDNQKRISCIPAGEYSVRIRVARESASRDYVHLLVQDVKDRSYILFHRGNRAEDTRGCILVGQSREQDFVGNSTLAMNLLMKEVLNLGGENINLIIKNR
jgi:predicted neuraminidase